MEESVGSPNSPTPAPESSSAASYQQQQHQHVLYDRITRALTHDLRLLDRTNSSDFFVLGFTGNVYYVTLSASLACTCPDRAPVPCKHILFVLLKVLSVSLHDPIIRNRKTLRPCQLRRLLAAPTSEDNGVVAGVRARMRFRQVFFGNGGDDSEDERRKRIEGACPVCLDEMGTGREVLVCGICGNGLHTECFKRWKRSRGRRSATCVICRSRWREKKKNEKYVNLSAYVEADGGGDGGAGIRSGGGDVCSSSTITGGAIQ